MGFSSHDIWFGALYPSFQSAGTSSGSGNVNDISLRNLGCTTGPGPGVSMKIRCWLAIVDLHVILFLSHIAVRDSVGTNHKTCEQILSYIIEMMSLAQAKPPNCGVKLRQRCVIKISLRAWVVVHGVWRGCCCSQFVRVGGITAPGCSVEGCVDPLPSGKS